MLRTLSVGCVLACLAIAEAFACRGPDFERTIIFDDVPISLDAPVIVEVTINDMKDIVDSQRMRWAVINARVERVIKGPIHDGTLKVVAPVSDCTAGFDVGSHGIVIGELRHDAHGTLELVAIDEFKIARFQRKVREQGK